MSRDIRTLCVILYAEIVNQRIVIHPEYRTLAQLLGITGNLLNSPIAILKATLTMCHQRIGERQQGFHHHLSYSGQLRSQGDVVGPIEQLRHTGISLLGSGCLRLCNRSDKERKKGEKKVSHINFYSLPRRSAPQPRRDYTSTRDRWCYPRRGPDRSSPRRPGAGYYQLSSA